MPYAEYHRTQKEKERYIRRKLNGEIKYKHKSSEFKYVRKSNPEWNKGNKNPNWKGGIKHERDYICIKLENHPYKTKHGYVYEHRLVMETHLGRILLPTEVVHHINGNAKDNRIENLMLFSDNGKHISFHHKNKIYKR